MPGPDDPALDPLRLFQALDRHGVDYLVVAGNAARAYGATRLTDDADCVVDRDDDNLGRLAGALRELNARLRVSGMTDEEAKQLPVQLDSRGLRQMALTTWRTDVGPVDILDGLKDRDGRIIPYEELASRPVVFDVGGTTVRVAALDDVITAKEHADRPKDQEALPELRALRAASEAPNVADALRDAALPPRFQERWAPAPVWWSTKRSATTACPSTTCRLLALPTPTRA